MRIADLQKNWETLGKTRPLCAILNDAAKQKSGWKLEEFFATGVQEIEGVLNDAARLGLELRRGRALDFGCGVGRLTQALARHFDEVHGVDIASSMIERAREHNRHGARCQFHSNAKPDLSLFPDEFFDFIYSNITLQHIAPEYTRGYLREFRRVLAPGGYCIFQLPAEFRPDPQQERSLKERLKRALPPLYAAYRWLRYRHDPVTEMHAIPKEELTGYLQAVGFRIADVTENNAAGKLWLSYRYCVQKM